MTYEFTFKGLSVGSDPRLQLVGLEGVHDTPDVRSSDSDRARAHGQWAGVDLLGGRAITATVQVAAVHSDPVWAQLQSVFVAASGDESPLSVVLPGFAGGATVQADVRVRRCSIPVDVERYQFSVPQMVVEWWATDPRWYAESATVVSTSVGGGSGAGMEFDAGFDLSFGEAAPSGVVNVTNTGTFPAPWTLEVSGSVTNLRIENVTTGATLRFTGTPAAGQTLVVDSYSRQVTLGGVSRYSWLDPGSRWFDLAPGVTQLRVASSSGSGVGTLTFRSAWI
jgi:hypothetical protein